MMYNDNIINEREIKTMINNVKQNLIYENETFDDIDDIKGYLIEILCIDFDELSIDDAILILNEFKKHNERLAV